MTNIDPSLPLIDLHRHLDGSLRLSTIIDLAQQHNRPLPAYDIEGLRPHVQVSGPVPGLLAFFDRFELLRSVMVDYESCYRIAYENVADAQAEGLDYIELRFSPLFMAERHGLDLAGVVDAVVSGVYDACEELAMPARLTGILSRQYGPQGAQKELEALLTARERITALDLAGDEGQFPAPLFIEHFRRARDAGWRITAHAGEDLGPESIWSALHDLGAERIGHAVRAFEDPGLIDHLARHQIGIESNLTSNVQTGIVASYAEHPLRRFLEAGIKATINTDDPGISNIDLAHEYNVAAPAAGLTPAQIRQAQHNALDIAFLTADEKLALLPPRARRQENRRLENHGADPFPNPS
jgi:adenosine deaminase